MGVSSSWQDAQPHCRRLNMERCVNARCNASPLRYHGPAPRHRGSKRKVERGGSVVRTNRHLGCRPSSSIDKAQTSPPACVAPTMEPWEQVAPTYVVAHVSFKGPASALLSCDTNSFLCLRRPGDGPLLSGTEKTLAIGKSSKAGLQIAQGATLAFFRVARLCSTEPAYGRTLPLRA
ncbi:hypothetical protein BD289DRAFT_105935 [Coniella lustricola]|uniref:Uncharacterized protein n=1 Tax=Coniella lustricola TaxID=2025994 RepID=A0A2T2ZXQ1_9PEZI|nr:hypothetical protein BD289DRAFT_105935 [Coniella lustricola]